VAAETGIQAPFHVRESGSVDAAASEETEGGLQKTRTAMRHQGLVQGTHDDDARARILPSLPSCHPGG